MIPNNELIRSSNKVPYQYYDNELYSPLIAKVMAGYDIRDTSEGLTGYEWSLYFDIESRIFRLDKNEKFVDSFGAPPYGRIPTDLDLAFDDQMRLYWGYSYLDTEGDATEKRIEFNWYNPAQRMTVKLILDGAYSLKVCLDDKRKSLIDYNDVVLVYVREYDRTVCCRYQRELFQVEHPLFLLQTGETLLRVDTTVENQLQFEIGRLQRPTTWVKLLDDNGKPVFNHKGHPIWVKEYQMSESYGSRTSLSDMSPYRTVNGTEAFIIVSKGEEALMSLATYSNYLTEHINLDGYLTRSDANTKFLTKAEGYSSGQIHELFEAKGHAYPRAVSDDKFALKVDTYSVNQADIRFATKAETYTKEESDVTFRAVHDSYSKYEVDDKFLLKSEYTTPEIDFSPYLTKVDASNLYARQTDVYTPAHIDQNFVQIGRLEDYYTKEEIEAKFKERAYTTQISKDNLFKNGYVEYGTLEGWSEAFTLTTAGSPTKPYPYVSFSGECQRIPLDQLIPIALKYVYTLTTKYRYVNKITPGIDLRVTFQQLDRDKKVMAGIHTGHSMQSYTQLTAPLKPGDTQIRVTSVEGWYAMNPGTFGYGNILVFNYVDEGGHMYDDIKIPYTRNIQFGEMVPFKENDNAANNLHLDEANGIVTLNSPWTLANPNTPDGVFPVGTKIARSMPYAGPDELVIPGTPGFAKQFIGNASNILVNTRDAVSRYNSSGMYKADRLLPGALYLRPVIYPNYNFMLDGLEYAGNFSASPAATDQDIVEIESIYLTVEKPKEY